MTFLLTLIVGAFLLWQAVCLLVLVFARLFEKLDKFDKRQRQRALTHPRFARGLGIVCFCAPIVLIGGSGLLAVILGL